MNAKSIRIFFFALLSLSGIIVAQDKDPQKPDIVEQLVTMAENVLSGKNTQQVLETIAPGSQIICGKETVDLRGVITGEIKTVPLVEDSTRRSVAVHLKTNEREDAAYLVLTTAADQGKHPRLHTIVFMKDKSGNWLMELWHVSN